MNGTIYAGVFGSYVLNVKGYLCTPEGKEDYSEAELFEMIEDYIEEA